MPNRLVSSASPYLRQHQDNPVDWYEWSEEAFAEARRRDVPVLLSVGYSACHWCHVMAHESFEDETTAAEMNRLFVSVKVDREERPDIDAIYMAAVQATTGHGGWPMTVWLTPDGKPFYAGTYFPKSDRAGLPGFQRVMAAVTEAWNERRDGIEEQAERIAAAIDRTLPVGSGLPGRDGLEEAYRKIEHAFDGVNGGFGGAPKFPQQPTLDFLLRISGCPWAPRARAMLVQTLTKMARGGIHDHIGGGFARYAVDSEWMIPHFEKMLYDNAQLARIYLRAGQAYEMPPFTNVADRILEYMRRDLRHPEGAFYSAEDADSEGREGTFYIWTFDEFGAVLGSDATVMARFYGVSPGGNFEGSTVLHEASTPAEIAENSGIDVETFAKIRRRADPLLFEARARRERPGLDHKIVASWNGLAIRALAEAGAVLDRSDLIADAEACARFLLTRMRRQDGRLLRTWADDVQGVPAFLEDYGAVATGLFTLYQATGDLEWYRAGAELTRAIPDLFEDPAGGYFTTGCDAEALITRPKDQMDNPLPSGNSLAAEALLTLSLYTADPALREAAERTIAAGSALIEGYPSAAGHLLGVAHTITEQPLEVAITGPEARRLARVVWNGYHPRATLALGLTASNGDEVPLLADRWNDGLTLAYVCRDFVCDAPVSDAADLAAALIS